MLMSDDFNFYSIYFINMFINFGDMCCKMCCFCIYVYIYICCIYILNLHYFVLNINNNVVEMYIIIMTKINDKHKL